MNNPFNLKQLVLDSIRDFPSAEKLARYIDEEILEQIILKPQKWKHEIPNDNNHLQKSQDAGLAGLETR